MFKMDPSLSLLHFPPSGILIRIMDRCYRMLVINPGSTSTKMSVFENSLDLFTESVFHDAPELLRYRTVAGQMPLRRRVVLDFLSSHDIPPGIDRCLHRTRRLCLFAGIRGDEDRQEAI